MLRARGDYARFFADDIALTINADERHGPADAEPAIRIHARGRLRRASGAEGTIVGDHGAAVEAEFV